MARTDEQIKTDIVNRMSRDPRVDASGVLVEVDRGTVRLTGSVPTYNARLAAFDNAWSVRGTVAVHNDIKVLHAATANGPTDDEIQSNAQSILKWNPDIDTSNVQVLVESGIVKLKGTTRSFWERTRAEEIISHVRGVIDIQDEIAIVPTKTPYDEDIAREIVEALEANMFVNAADIDVQVVNGVVTLSGSVPNWNVLRNAYDTARYTLGVLGIRNNITVTGEG